jgi:septum site-determining protein MinC
VKRETNTYKVDIRRYTDDPDCRMIEPTISLDKTDDVTDSSPLVNRYSQIRLKNDGERMLLILPTQAEISSDSFWSETWQELKHLLKTKEQSWQTGTNVCLVAKDRLLDVRQLQTIAETLENVKLFLSVVRTNRRQTAVAAATSGYSVEQNSVRPMVESEVESAKTASTAAKEDVLYLLGTIRSGEEIRHPGTVVIFGDLNPGAKAIAAGDILVWGRLRGIAHAGAQGNHECRITALKMEFTQLRIADAVARAPKLRPRRLSPELAFMTTEGISLAKTSEFTKRYIFSASQKAWVDKDRKK